MIKTDIELRYEAENARLRAQLTKVAPAIIRGGFDLSSETLARIIWRLYRAAPEAWVPLYDLELEVNAVMPNENTTRVYVRRVRLALGNEFVETGTGGAGYRLSVDARARVAALMGD